MIKFTKATKCEARLISNLARPIWEEHYTPIIGKEQVEYMLSNLQNPETIEIQIAEGFDYYIVYQFDESIGYFATLKKEQRLFISKFYLSSLFRGQGLARLMMQQIVDIAVQKNCNQLELTINKYNPTLEIYLKLGFIKVEAITIDIGGGFIMDDFRMVKNLD